MNATREDASYFSRICTETCRGMCCDPWWGIISYTVVKRGGLSGMSSFRDELIKGIREREKRITDAYVTNEEPPRALFSRPERYNVVVRDIRAEGTTLKVQLLAMYAFRCAFLSDDKVCTIHPAVLGGGEIRPPHCGYLGSPEARPDEKGYCRIIHAAEGSDGGDGAVMRAIEIERGASERNLREGVDTIEEAADRVLARVRAYAESTLPNTAPVRSDKGPGRNDPCTCGSGRKFKKCHGG